MDQKGHYPHQVSIDFYGNGGFRFAEMSHKGSLLCLPSGMHAWNVTKADGIDANALKPVLEQADNIDVLLLGTGTDISFFPAKLRELLREHEIIVEAVGTGSAVRTYNILFAEQRAIAAALISVEHASSIK